jgi:hypothetical protein
MTGVAVGVGASTAQLLPRSSQSTHESFQQKRQALTDEMRTTASAAERKTRIVSLRGEIRVRM